MTLITSASALLLAAVIAAASSASLATLKVAAPAPAAPRPSATVSAVEARSLHLRPVEILATRSASRQIKRGIGLSNVKFGENQLRRY
ncbi:MAG: hypothetical protein CMN17_10155 [Roseovarius sp.]|nr:hypothetical protein [Roseovarius sp.]MBK45158.1 hypothetical protein [Roseovarius sp.]